MNQLSFFKKNKGAGNGIILLAVLVEDETIQYGLASR